MCPFKAGQTVLGKTVTNSMREGMVLTWLPVYIIAITDDWMTITTDDVSTPFTVKYSPEWFKPVE